MTETSGTVVCLVPEDHEPDGERSRLLRSVGKPLPWLEIRISAVGEDAELAPSAAYRDEEGYVFLHDRIKDMVISGGENVYPAEVENALSEHPEVAEVAVIGVPHERWGETVKAIVVRREGATVEAEELREFTRARLARYKCPTSVDFRAELPRNAAGKVMKHALRAEYADLGAGVS